MFALTDEQKKIFQGFRDRGLKRVLWKRSGKMLFVFDKREDFDAFTKEHNMTVHSGVTDYWAQEGRYMFMVGKETK